MIFFVGQRQWLAKVVKVKLFIVYLFRFTARDGGETKICTLDLINTNRALHWACSENVCTDAQYVTLQKYFLHPGLVFFFNYTHKTKIRTTNRCRTTNSKPFRQVSMMGQSKTHSSSLIIIIGAQCCCTFFSHYRLM
jgi:hypothetical protein